MEYLLIAVFSQIVIVIFLFKDDLTQKNAEKLLWFLLINSACILLLKFGFLIFEENVLYKSYSPSISMASPPLIYIYIKSILSGSILTKKKQLLHFLPTILFTIAFVIVGLNILFFKDYSWIIPYKKGYDVTYFLINTVYYTISLYLLYHSKNKTIRWLQFPLLLWAIAGLILYAGKIGLIPKLISLFIIFSLVGLLLFLILFLKNRFNIKLSFPKQPKEHVSKYEKSSLKPEQKNDILKTLDDYMVKDKPYLNHNLSLTDLANSLGISKHNITEVLNLNLEKNFFLFINEYRIKEAKAKMEKDEKESLSLIAHFSGFKSKTTFIKYFKEIVGMTPSEYRKNQNS